ncbi:MAG TPA: helix-turn-helix domain-containing protein [Tepidisphaeraceae bacterium]|nr:helix-turn-helix domain-containing protein [Tepidisphaeraceae bacterium]
MTNNAAKALLGTDAVSRSEDRASSAKIDFITVEDWAARLQVSKRTIFRMVDEGVIPPYDFAVGKTKRWHISTYNKWVAARVGVN